MQSPIRLLLVDDHEIFLDGLTSLLDSQPEFEVMASHTSGENVLTHLHDQDLPDLLITDLSMPGMTGIELVRQVKQHFPDLPTLVLSMHNDRETIAEITMAEAEGYVLKNCDRQELFTAIQRIHAGSTYYCHEVMSIILERIQVSKKTESEEVSLTSRECEILKLIAEEKSSEEIADELYISKRTVETHRKNMLKKTNTNTVVGLLKYGVKMRLVSL